MDEIGWRFWLDTPGNDFGRLLTPYAEVAEAAVSYVEQTVGKAEKEAAQRRAENEERRQQERKEALRRPCPPMQEFGVEHPHVRTYLI